MFNKYEELQNQEDPITLEIESKQDSVLKNTMLCSFIWAFGGQLDQEQRDKFEIAINDIIQRKFDLTLSSITGKSKHSFSLFEIFYDTSYLSWDLLTEKVEYKTRSHFDPKAKELIIPSLELAQVFNLFERLVLPLNHPLMLTGGEGTQKSTILKSILKKRSDEVREISYVFASSITLLDF